MLAPYNVITAHFAKWPTSVVEPIVFGPIDPRQIADFINAFCQKELEAAVADYLFYEASQGAVCGVRLIDGRRVVLKIHQPSRSVDFLQAVIQVQHYLLAQGYPCTTPLLNPKPLALGTATVEELVDEGIYHEAYDPIIRRSLAHMLAWLIRLTWTPEAIPGLRPTNLDLRLPAGVTWPTPHSKIFDFAAMSTGAEWIDEIARQTGAVKLQGAGRLVLGHADWSVKHLRYVGKHVRIIYDWDSLVLEKEPVIVGHASANFTYTEFFDGPRFPTDEESQAFIADYEDARGKPFSQDELQTLQAAKIYALAYGARCEHALKPDETSYPEGSCRALLAQYK